ncbi:hypothetical protein LTR48_006609 [Friedmanniomyces endolithicus]|uniref:Prion-inhibition and propagation HeLo domain-containing protein n=1 Tax=Rachicladosporium monterosium TaxID=1507873 RepID=A0ABR0KYH8_9PEZI|nr:hypothetical protein LTR29_013402 [Friedmanniomyces endolithicus]KAK1082976.1 hypothetical protein LTR48_006609 [Friedmanniomyces endolithicus]KAK1812215.1 hypothetical protein LTR12_013421 [Friedmanniomyces endolithicus]KAK5140674.1 hypothetical protein LTR32_006585 [Rachicladosporium monterosium]
MGPIWAQDAPNRARRQTLVRMIRELQVWKRGLPKCHLEASLRLIISRVKRDSADFRFVVAVNPGAAIESLRKATADFQEAAAQETGDLAIPALEVGMFVSLLEDLGAELSYRKNQDESNNVGPWTGRNGGLCNKSSGLLPITATSAYAEEVETQSDYLSEEGTVALTTSKTLDITPSGVT